MADGDIVFVCGAKRTGKTSGAVRALIRDVRVDRRSALVYDPTHDVYARLVGNSASGDHVPMEAIKTCQKADEAREWITGESKSRADMSWFELQRLSIRNSVLANIPRAPRIALFNLESLEEFLTAAVADWADKLVIFVDECEGVFPNKTTLPAKENRLLRTIGNRGARLYLVSQRPQHVAISVRANADWVLSFAHRSELVCESLARECQGEIDQWSKALDLEQHHAIVRPPAFKRGDSFQVIDARTASFPWQRKDQR